MLDAIKKYWMKFAYGVAWVNTRIILTIVYLIVFAPFALIMRLLRTDHLRLRKGDLRSYWIKKENVDPTIDRHRRQF